ncbi:hypothetical protein DAEQUDRAFT_723127 [Daedalea quercina L-15889]|uniref:Uncharacterized protein n=1 Tax=Daedalea quercina L-15889 TaxID=1314783 RepID=A0A165SS74_9APHY|nr:hypothetical protein DAEQUDRAFT_723127 [Daedalea quercina L-15889]
MQLSFGAFIAGVLIGTRGRQIRRLYLLPPTAVVNGSQAGTRQVVVQALTNIRNRAYVAPLEECNMRWGQDASKLSVEMPGVRGPFSISLGAKNTVDGEELPMGPAKEEIFKLWYGEALARKVRGEEGWKQLP